MGKERNKAKLAAGPKNQERMEFRKGMKVIYRKKKKKNGAFD